VGERKISFPIFPSPGVELDRQLRHACCRADPSRMELASLNFAVWWYVTLACSGSRPGSPPVHGSRSASNRSPRVSWSDRSGLVMYSLRADRQHASPHDLQLRFFCALGISWLVAMRAMPAGGGPAGYRARIAASPASTRPTGLCRLLFMVCGASWLRPLRLRPGSDKRQVFDLDSRAACNSRIGGFDLNAKSARANGARARRAGPARQATRS